MNQAECDRLEWEKQKEKRQMKNVLSDYGASSVKELTDKIKWVIMENTWRKEDE